jgi:hypothetical protein
MDINQLKRHKQCFLWISRLCVFAASRLLFVKWQSLLIAARQLPMEDLSLPERQHQSYPSVVGSIQRLLQSTHHDSGGKRLGVLSNDDWKFHSNELIIEIVGFEKIMSELM